MLEGERPVRSVVVARPEVKGEARELAAKVAGVSATKIRKLLSAKTETAARPAKKVTSTVTDRVSRLRKAIGRFIPELEWVVKFWPEMDRALRPTRELRRLQRTLAEAVDVLAKIESGR